MQPEFNFKQRGLEHNTVIRNEGKYEAIKEDGKKSFGDESSTTKDTSIVTKSLLTNNLFTDDRKTAYDSITKNPRMIEWKLELNKMMPSQRRSMSIEEKMQNSMLDILQRHNSNKTTSPTNLYKSYKILNEHNKLLQMTDGTTLLHRTLTMQ